MDRIDAAVTSSAAAPPPTGAAPTSGLGLTFRALASGTAAERRRRSLRGTPRPGRVLGAAGDVADDSGTWRLAL